MRTRRKKGIRWLCALIAALLAFGLISVRQNSPRAAAYAAEEGDATEATPSPSPTPSPTPKPDPKPTDPPQTQKTATTPPTDAPETGKTTPPATDAPETGKTTPPPTDPTGSTPPSGGGNEPDPDKPTNPETSDDPDDTEDPENPGTSGGPDNPENPDDPKNPGTSGDPDDPENPDNPKNPGTSGDPDDPTNPETSGDPDDPDNPDNPENPETSGDPDDPDASASPEPSIDPNATLEPNAEDQSPDMVEDPGGLVLKDLNPYSGWYGVEPSDERGMPIPVLYQTDYPEIVCTIRGLPRSVSSSGCGATSVSMVIAYLTGNTEQTPYTLFYRAVETGRYYGAGLDHDTLSWLLKQYGVSSKWISNSGEAIVNALQEGKPVVAHMGPGIFTKLGHYVVLRGVTEDGKILLNDPVSPIKTSRAFPVQTLLTQARNGHAFMVCWPDPKVVEEPTQEPVALNPATAPEAENAVSVPMPVVTPAPITEESLGMPVAPDAIVPRPPMPAIVAAAYGAQLTGAALEEAAGAPTDAPTPEPTPAPTPKPAEAVTPEPVEPPSDAESTPLPAIVAAAREAHAPRPTFEVAVDATLEPKA